MRNVIMAAAAVLLAGSTPAAFAFELNCGAPRVAVGDDLADGNPVVRVEVKYNKDDHAWRIFHHRRDGMVVSRGEQYAMQDATNERKIQWQGSLNRNRSLYMIGEVKRAEDGSTVYMEWMYDKGKGGIVVMHAATRCVKVAPAEPALPTPTTSIPGVLPSTVLNTLPPALTPKKVARLYTSRVKIYAANQGSSAMIDVLMGGQPVRMLLDTGATTCLINFDLAKKIVRDGQGEWDGTSKFKMADGTFVLAPMVMIKELRIGEHTVRNVKAGVSDADVMILSFPVVNNIAPFTIDTRVGELIWHHTES